MDRAQLRLFGGFAVVFSLAIMVGASWLERPALGLTLATGVACLALVLIAVRRPARGRSRSRARS